MVLPKSKIITCTPTPPLTLKTSAESAAPGASTRSNSYVASRTPPHMDPEQPKTTMHTDQDSESQMEAVTSVDDDFLSPDEVNYEETSTDAENAENIRKQGLAIRELRTHEVSRAIVQTCGGPANITEDDFLLRIRPGSNYAIASTPEERTAERILNIKELELRGNRHSVNTYISTPNNLLKGVIHGLEPGTTEDELIHNLRVRTQGVRILYARRLGKSRTVVLTFDGPTVPRYAYYYGGETPCTPYQPTRQYCKICQSQGHRTDVSPTPTIKICAKCGLRDPPAAHECEPERALCGGAHPTAAPECTKTLKRVPQRGRQRVRQHNHLTGTPKKKWLSSDRESSDPQERNRSCTRSTSRGRSNSRGRKQEEKQSTNQPKNKKQSPKNEGDKNKVSWSAIASQPTPQITAQITRLEREQELMRVRLGDLERENAILNQMQSQKQDTG
ncbi:hypothetical protein HPB49_016295 [Dermacentor silvarum]|uniref:Uncharacterized protein n=1 Tax=Dermacentor silvarum TaxID=543639 RepID=A0ACB8CG46_DERSI|nr:hypothetical protein HPB49_016295 [Dermacentor silvarum]